MNDSPSGAPEEVLEAVRAARVRQAELLSTVGRLAGGIAHDFNNLLTTIVGYAELLDNQLRLRGDCRAERKDLHEIQVAAERAQNETRRLLGFAQRLHTRTELVEPQQIVRGMERLLRRLAPPQAEFVATVTSVPGWIEVDRAQIERALTNLTVNAFDSISDGGSVTISAEWRDVRTEGLPAGVVIGRDDHLSGPCVEFRVSDNGRGMSAEYVQQAFLPFETTKTGDGIGDGLGLSEVYGLVAKANGLTLVESGLNAGTIVHVLIPRASSPPDQESPRDELSDE
jgi:two-component system, cell cycle sensor histidine kinase and response regulator CckA